MLFICVYNIIGFIYITWASALEPSPTKRLDLILSIFIVLIFSDISSMKSMDDWAGVVWMLY